MTKGRVKPIAAQFLLAGLAFAFLAVPAAEAKTHKVENDAQLRAQYIASLDDVAPRAVPQSVGSLWTPQSPLEDLSSDYKARRLNDTVTILVAVQTTAAQNADVTSQRTFQTTSGITGLAGALKTTGLNPLFAANSSTALKGSGATDSSTTFQTSMTGQVIAVLPGSNLVIEAHRTIFMNNQHEDVTIRGVVRPDDIGPNNTIPSSALSNLEIDVKGKGIISDSTRPPNRLTRAILWLVGF